jgi:hypothetical protein
MEVLRCLERESFSTIFLNLQFSFKKMTIALMLMPLDESNASNHRDNHS